MNVLSLCGQEVGLTKNPSVSYLPTLCPCSFTDNKKVTFDLGKLSSLYSFQKSSFCSFSSGDLLIVWRPGHDGGARERRVVGGGRNQRGHARRHRQWAAVQSVPRLWLPGCGAGGRRGDLATVTAYVDLKYLSLSFSLTLNACFVHFFL